ncbi:MAG: type II toxin-antitoxin system HicA family toxin [Deltaproteobacteria bacterium]|nr:type II toxin-antitoxin system HicA family toxin [Deltaproteobacteria bacterium]
MPKLPVISGRKMVHVLRKLGYEEKRQRGSHLIMIKEGKLIVVPNHKELRRGTLRSIMREANLTVGELIALL